MKYLKLRKTSLLSLLLIALSLLALNCSTRAEESSRVESQAEERKSAAEWLEIVKAQTIEFKKHEDDNLAETLLLYGATQAPANMPKNHIDLWPAKYRDGLKAYLTWWASEGEDGFKKWRNAGFPPNDDKHHVIYHAKAMEMYSAVDLKLPENKDIAQYGDAIVKRGKEILQLGCTGHSLSSSEIADLRLYAMFQSHIHPGPDVPLPSFKGLMPPSSMPGPGDTAGDFTLPEMNEILERPSYSDTNPSEDIHLFRPDILVRLLQIMAGYEAADASGTQVKVKPYMADYKNPVTLSSFKGKKPVLFMCADATDTWWWSGTVAPLWGPLYEAVKDQVEIFFVHTTVYDQFMPGVPGSSEIPGSRGLHCTSLEARARTSKICYMYYPTLTVPYLLDDLSEHAENAYRNFGGDSATFLADKSGTISFSLWQRPECNDYMWVDSDQGNPYQLPLRAERVMNLVECNLKALLDAGGIWRKDMKPVVPDWKMSPLLQDVELVGIEPGKKQLTVKDKDKNIVTIAFDEQTRIWQNADHKSLADFKVGEKITIYYQKDTKATGWMARIFTSGPALYDFWYTPATWVPMEVQSIDLSRGTIEAKLTLPVKECKGMNFWKTASPELLANFGAYATSIPKIFQNIASHADQVLTLHVDRATDMFLNGMITKLSDLKVGDKMGIELPNEFKVDAVWPHFIRVYRFQAR